MAGNVVAIPVLIPNGQSLSAAINVGGSALVGLQMPAAAWDAAGITFVVSADGGSNFLPLCDKAGTEVALTVTFGKFIALDTATFGGILLVKVRSGTSATPVNQTADRTLQLVTREEF